jgi:flagellin-like hook-associated protein FlgL
MLGGINVSVNGGVARSNRALEMIDSTLNESLKRLESGNRISRSSDDPIGLSKALTLNSDISEIKKQQLLNAETMKNLEDTDTAMTNVLSTLSDMKEALTKYVAEGDLATETQVAATYHGEIAALYEQYTALIANNTNISSGTHTYQWGTTAAQGITHSGKALVGTTDFDATNVDTLTATGTAFAGVRVGGEGADMLLEVSAALDVAMRESAAIGVLKNNVMASGMTRLADQLANITTQRDAIMKTDEATESAIITSLQLRQQAVISAIGVRNGFVANTVNLIG